MAPEELEAARAARAQPKASLCAVRPPVETERFVCDCGASFTMRRTLEPLRRVLKAKKREKKSKNELDFGFDRKDFIKSY